MKIALYLMSGIYVFRLPNQVLGSFSFDSEDITDKLINIDARDGKWVMYSTSEVSIINNNTSVKDIILENNNFYTLKRAGKYYLIHVSSLLNSKMDLFEISERSKLIIGNNNNCNIKYNCPYVNNLMLGITFTDNKINIQREGNTAYYVDKIAIVDKNKSFDYGIELDIYGLRIKILKNIMFVSRLSNLVISNNLANISNLPILSSAKPEDIKIKDVDLYKKEDYASKAPRIRRLIEDKKIKVANPPNLGKKEELPLILVIGPMLTMSIISFSMLTNTVLKLINGSVKLSDSWSQLLMSLAMLISTILCPTLTKKYEKKKQKAKEEEIRTKYTNYLMKKNDELQKESILEKAIITENLITLEQCIENIKKRNINFWSKRIDQNDFLLARIGIGKEKLKAEINFSEDELEIEENALKNDAKNLIKNYEYINEVPIGYSFYENIITAIMGKKNQTVAFVNNIILQFMSFYSYEDLKIVVFTNENNESNWDYIKYLNHNFTNDKSLRFFGSTYESRKIISDYLSIEASIRIDNNSNINKPHYLIIVDDYEKIKRYGFINTILDADKSLGFSFIIVENLLSKLPSKCDNFITINDSESGILKNSYEAQEKQSFKHEINENINMYELVKYVANVPVEFEQSVTQLPNSINFLEMEQVGKIEQLNILNRWSINDSSISLKTEIGVDEQGDLMYLDLHEKFHGPHGLIAGTTGSGKSEFIITYILSLSMNYSPDDVSFILIDYKGGGLAFAFENKLSGVSLPHLAGTITNLDKAEMDRTLVSIDSEVKRRQKMFNSARDILGESTIDIYKYQKFYKEGRIKDPIPHLFIICDEFAELKSQQPEFMDNLISVARIGRSLGVHLILATQKPSGVVNDQIWSNSRFKVCLKVQDESDSKEMIKRKDAAYIKQAGRFFLQVGYDEFFALGQSAWCGAKYYPSDKIVTEVDKSINFIDSAGNYIKSIQAGSNIKVKPEGEQLSNVLNEIIMISNKTNKRAKKLWLDNIPGVIINSDLEKKYNFKDEPYNIKTLIGEYDAPEKQEQGSVIYDFLEDGNTIIYGSDGSEREMLLETIIYSSVKNHSVDEINYYIIDYGSESFRKYNTLCHIGGIVYIGEDEKYNNLVKLIRKNINDRKKLFANYGGEYKNYIKSSGNKLPIKVIIVNNYDSVYESNNDAYDTFAELTRDSERYGIVFIFTGNSISSIQLKLSQNFHNIYAFKLKDKNDYTSVFGIRCNVTLRDYKGRGIVKHDQLHEFQVSSLIENEDSINDFISNFINNINERNTGMKSEKIPVLPKYVRYDDVKESINGLKAVPIGLDKITLDPVCIDFKSNIGVIVSANKNEYIEGLLNSLALLLSNYKNIYFNVIDCMDNIKIKNIDNYCNSDFDAAMDCLISYIESMIEQKSNMQGVIIINGISKFLNKLSDTNKMLNLSKLLSKYENIAIMISDDSAKLKKLSFEQWFNSLFDTNYGIWVGKGVNGQTLLHLANVTREMTKEFKNNMGFMINESYPTLVKFIDFTSKEDDKNE